MPRDFLYCEETDTRIRNNDVVSISTYPDTKWIAKQGWYKIGTAQKNGWYFVSIKDKTIVPIELVDIKDITKADNSTTATAEDRVPSEVKAEPVTNNVDYLYIENQDLIIYPNDIVEVAANIGGDTVRCVAKYGWYEIDSKQKNGWYFITLSDRTVIPLEVVDTNTIVKEQIIGASELRPTLQDMDTPLPENQYIVIPGTDIRLYDSDIVKIDTRPNLKWIIHVGWYFYQDIQQYGWYFVSIKDGEILPVSTIDLTLCSLDVLKTQGSEIYDGRVVNYTRPFTPADAEILRRAFITVDTVEQRDNLDRQKLINGKLVRVNDVGGVVGYYSWNAETQTWEKVDWGSSGSGGIPEITGTADHPIVASELDEGLYRVIGYYKISPTDTETTYTSIDHLLFVSGRGNVQVEVVTESSIIDYTVRNGIIIFVDRFATESWVKDQLNLLEQKIYEIISEVMQPIPDEFIYGLFI